ncbi:hypothetical protein [Streptomyces sp. YIM S03343]
MPAHAPHTPPLPNAAGHRADDPQRPAQARPHPETAPDVVAAAGHILAFAHTAATVNDYGACTAAGYSANPGPDGRARIHRRFPNLNILDPNRVSQEQRWAQARTYARKYAATLEAAGWTVEHRTVTTGAILLAAPPRPDDTLRPFTVTVAGPDRDEGKAPYTYVVDAVSAEQAWAQAVARHMADEDTADVRVVAAESFEGEPPRNCGYAFNDLRAPVGDDQEAEPGPLRWGLDDVMHGDDGHTIVLLSDADRRPYRLDLGPGRAAALRDALAGLGENGAAQPGTGR